MHYYLNLNADFLKNHPAVIGVAHLDEEEKPSREDYYDCPADARERGDLVTLVDALMSAPEFKLKSKVRRFSPGARIVATVRQSLGTVATYSNSH